MYALGCLALAATVASCGSNANKKAAADSTATAQAQAPAEDEGWTVIFDGKTLDGWRGYDKTGVPAAWTVEDGAISLSGKFGYIRTEIPYADYRLNAEWRWPDSATNSGIFLHIQRDGIWPNCYECQLWNGKAGDLIHSSGTESAELRADSTLIILPKLEPSTEKPVGEWNTAEIVCSDSTITVHVNGRLQNRLTGLSNRQGFIGLQSEGGPVQFRNIILTPLD